MIIKSFSRTSPDMGEIIRYITDEMKEAEKPLSIYHNLFSHDINDIINAFEDNLLYQGNRNKNTAYHIILSWHPKDNDRITRKAVYDLTQKYIQLRAPKSLWFGALHADQLHPHMHLLLSGNELQSPKASSIRRKDFYRIRTEIEEYQKEQFPELVHSLHYGHYRDYPLRFLRQKLLPAYEYAQSKETFYSLANDALNGRATLDPQSLSALYQGRAYPLADIGIDLDLFDQLQQLRDIRKKSHERDRERSL